MPYILDSKTVRQVGMTVAAMIGAATFGGCSNASPSSSTSAPTETAAAEPAAAPAGDSALDEASIKQCVLTKNGFTEGQVQWGSVQAAPGFAASNAFASQFEVDPGTMLYPALVSYVSTTGSGPSAYVRDVVQHYLFSKDRFGAWVCDTDTKVGDKNELRGGYASQ